MSRDHADGPQEKDIHQIKTELEKHFSVRDVRLVAHCAEGDISSLISILGDARTWLAVLSVPAYAYLKRIGQNLADATMRGLGSRFEKNETPLADIVTTIEREINKKYKEPVEVLLGLDSPNKRLGTVILMQSGDTKEDIAFRLASFCAACKTIETNLNEFLEMRGYHQEAVSQVSLEFQEAGRVVASWQVFQEGTISTHELLISVEASR